MGNSGSVNHMQSGLKELHSYYQVQSNGHNSNADEDFDFSDKANPLMIQISTNRERELTSLPAAKTLETNNCNQIKVLPIVSSNLRLRSTRNGAILHSGGTISGRRESVLSNPTMTRSKTLIAENSEQYMNRTQFSTCKIPMTMMNQRSKTQLDINIRKGIPNTIADQNVNLRHSTSNLDLRRQSTSKENIETQCNDTFQKLSKAKLKNKKRKAPPVPASSSEIPFFVINQSNDLERKQRLFKTKVETTANLGKQPFKRQSQPEEQLSEVVMKTNLSPGYRREKSFDAKLLLIGSSRNSPNIAKRKSLEMTKATNLLPSPVVLNRIEKSNITTHFEGSTKSHLRSFKKSTDHSARQRDPSEERRKFTIPNSKPNRSETQSKIPQLKKTFYFGMESSKRKQLETTKIMPNNCIPNVEKLDETRNSFLKDLDEVYSLNHTFDSEMKNDNSIQLNVRPTLPRRQLEIPRFSPVAAWRTLSAADEHRKEQHAHSTTIFTSPSPPLLNAAIETANTFLFEDRIHRTYRDPCPFYADNKSGDSGISGDDGYMVEKPIQPQNLEYVQKNFGHELTNYDRSYPVEELGTSPMELVGPFLTAWTPQQDLEDEEDSSFDGDKVKLTENMANSLTPRSPHVFSLSLPREIQFANYREKNKQGFRSLQKLKRTTSIESNVINGGCNQSSTGSQNNLKLFSGEHVSLGNNFRSDNWVLSKTTGMTAAASMHVKKDSKNGVNRMNSKTNNNYFDMSASTQPISLGSLATGKHVMYLPNQSTAHEFSKQSKATKTRPTRLEPTVSKNIKCFDFQNSVRQNDLRLADKLSKKADHKEAFRKTELEVMRRVEEEFQKKRAYEKASIRQQLRFHSMDDDNFMSLPNINDYRAEPDGAVSSASESSLVRKT
ncbi:uncharacterized protein LOC129953382 [Eupeodes corollae]|uniref:uncharacterized protein LOC129953382 n=1 Tax=Eupeodes corollae TaxID=290404 RepID=UPI00249273A7|nr:uncharacterized protein LOC129953382 [Eupeodes corollae]XP_055922511.1 uncharacterized protein LOC129953382 [Eupeodes corollae]